MSAKYMKASQNIEDEDIIDIPDDDNDNDVRANIINHSSSGEDDSDCMNIYLAWLAF
jgi:hypothetical protein